MIINLGDYQTCINKGPRKGVGLYLGQMKFYRIVK